MARGLDTRLETESDSSSDESDTTAPAPAPAARTPPAQEEWYHNGSNGLAKDAEQVSAWYERSAAARNTKGMALFGRCLLLGVGGSVDVSLGLVNVTEAAHLGSNVAAYILGDGFFNGNFGLPKDPARARYWLKKVVDGECEVQHMNDSAKATAAEWLRELDE